MDNLCRMERERKSLPRDREQFRTDWNEIIQSSGCIYVCAFVCICLWVCEYGCVCVYVSVRLCRCVLVRHFACMCVWVQSSVSAVSVCPCASDCQMKQMSAERKPLRKKRMERLSARKKGMIRMKKKKEGRDRKWKAEAEKGRSHFRKGQRA